jgi:peptide/nickel transport system permease protein
MVAGALLLFFYVSILFVEFLAPYNLETRHPRHVYAPPQAIHFFHEGEFVGPFVYGFDVETVIDMAGPAGTRTVRRQFTTDYEVIHPVRFFCLGDEYEFWGQIPMRFHIMCPAEGGTLYLLGTDRLGRDMLSRMIYGGRVSLTIGLVGIAVSFTLGIVFGGLAGYYGGWVDNVINRIIEIFQSFPQLPLWMALSAALPANWSPILIYFGITIILGLVDWTGLARAVRSKLLSLREEDFTTADQLMGAGSGRIIGRHLLPSFMSHLIASATLAIPGMILGETALSFLNLGLRPPITSLGVLLNEAQNINAVAIYPWIMLPVVPVILIVLAFQFFGDGLRDAADPYK